MHSLHDQVFNQEASICRKITKILPEDVLCPLRKQVTAISHDNANLVNYLITSRLVAGTLCFLNKTSITQCSKKQATT